MRGNSTLLFAITMMASLHIGCDNKENKGESAASASSSASVATAAPSGSAAKSADVAPPAPEPPKPPTVSEFLTKITPSVCSWIDQCKNDKVKVVTLTTGIMIAGFGTLDKPDLAKKVRPIGDTMKADKRSFPNKEECQTLGDVVLQVLGATPDSIQAKVGKTVRYDAEKSVACLAALEKPLSVCSTEFKVKGEPNFSTVASYEKEFKTELDAHLKVCEEVITGMADAGAACEFDFECKAEGSKCKGAAGKKKCTAGKAKKK